MNRIARLILVFISILVSAGCSDNTGILTATAETSQHSSPQGGYTVNLTRADFVQVVDNTYFPLIPGMRWEYEIRRGGVVVEKDVVEVLKETRQVNGILATVVRDTVFAGDKLTEDTYDWFAQDKDGNVWYVGESVDNYVGGVVVNHSGSWEWGVDGALPGIIMWADPAAHINEEYYQEYFVGHAEDKGRVLSVTESITVPFGSFDNVVKTRDFSTLEIFVNETKFYAPGIGLIKEGDANAAEEVLLVSFTKPNQ